MTQLTGIGIAARDSVALSQSELAAIVADFPTLATPARDGGRLAYLDSAATSQKPNCVIDTVTEFYERSNGAAGRSTYELADRATAAWDDARAAVASFVDARPQQRWASVTPPKA